MTSRWGKAKANDKAVRRIKSQPYRPAQSLQGAISTGEPAISREHANHLDARARQDTVVRDIPASFLRSHLQTHSLTPSALQPDGIKEEGIKSLNSGSTESAAREAGQRQELPPSGIPP